MHKPKLQITSKRYTGETTVISMRAPKDMVLELDRIAEKTGRTRNEIMMLCLEYAITNAEIVDADMERPTANERREKNDCDQM